jgi:hypothetical protein
MEKILNVIIFGVISAMIYVSSGIWGFIAIAAVFLIIVLIMAVSVFRSSDGENQQWGAAGESGYAPELDDNLKNEGWKLIHRSLDSGYSDMAEIYENPDNQEYRMILSNINTHPYRVEDDGRWDSFEEAKEVADEWAFSHGIDDE